MASFPIGQPYLSSRTARHSRVARRGRGPGAVVVSALCVVLLAGCTSTGPSRKSIEKAASSATIQHIRIVPLTDTVARALHYDDRTSGFAETFGDATPVGMIVGRGDVLEISIWEAPPAALFGTVAPTGDFIQTSRTTTLPEFLVGPTGSISIPFGGEVPVSGKTLPQIERDIVARLRLKAHLPQVIARLVRNATSNITVVGDVNNSVRVPLTSKGERLLDALAAAGGTNQPIDKMTVQVSRDGIIRRMRLQEVIEQPEQNIVLRTNDVVTAVYQPYSFTVLGASGRNEEIKFEGTGITLAQALGRLGGLQDNRADPKGVFLFRWEDPLLLDQMTGAQPVAYTDYDRYGGRVPVIYQINLNDPAVFFAMQNFEMRDEDVIFIANSSITEIQRFAGIIASTLLPAVAVENSISR